MPEAWDFLDIAGDSTVAESTVNDTLSSLEEDSIENGATNARAGTDDSSPNTSTDSSPNTNSGVMQHIMQPQPTARLSPSKKSKSRTEKKKEQNKSERKGRPTKSTRTGSRRSAKPRSKQSSSRKPRAAAADGDAVDLSLVNDLARTLSGYIVEKASPENIKTTLQDLYILPDFDSDDDDYSDTTDLSASYDNGRAGNRGTSRSRGGRRERRGDAGYKYWASAVGLLDQDESTVASSSPSASAFAARQQRRSGGGRRRTGNRSGRSGTNSSSRQAATARKVDGKKTAKRSTGKKSKGGNGSGRSRLERKISKARDNSSSKMRSKSKSRVELLGADYETSCSGSHRDASDARTRSSAATGTESRGGFRILLKSGRQGISKTSKSKRGTEAGQAPRSTKQLLVYDDEAEDGEGIDKTSKRKRGIEARPAPRSTKELMVSDDETKDGLGIAKTSKSNKDARNKKDDGSSGSGSTSSGRAKVDFLSDLRETIKDIKGAVDMVSTDLLNDALLGHPSSEAAPLLSEEADRADENEAPRTNEMANSPEKKNRKTKRKANMNQSVEKMPKQQQQARLSQPGTIEVAKKQSATNKQEPPSQKQVDTYELLRGNGYRDGEYASYASRRNGGRRKIRNLGRVVLHAVKVGSSSSGANTQGKDSSGTGGRSFVILPRKKSPEKGEKPAVYSQYISSDEWEADDADGYRAARITVTRPREDLDTTADTPIRINYKKSPEKDNPPKKEEGRHEKEKKNEQHEQTAAYAQIDVSDNSGGIFVPQVKSIVSMDTIRKSLFGTIFHASDDEENGDNAQSRDQVIIEVAEVIDTLYDDNLSESVSRLRARKMVERYEGKEKQLIASLRKKMEAKEAKKKERAGKDPSLDDAAMTDATEDISSPDPSPSSKHRPSDTFVPKLTSSPVELVDTDDGPWTMPTMNGAINAVVPRVTSALEDVGESKLVESLYKQFSRMTSVDESESEPEGEEEAKTAAKGSKPREATTDSSHTKISERPDKKKSARQRIQSKRSKAAVAVRTMAASMALSKKSKRLSRKNRNVPGTESGDNGCRMSQVSSAPESLPTTTDSAADLLRSSGAKVLNDFSTISRPAIQIREKLVSVCAPVCPVDLNGEIYSNYSLDLPPVEEEEEAGEEVSLSAGRLGVTTVAARAPVCPVDLDEDVFSDSDADIDEEGEEVSFNVFDQIVNPRGSHAQATNTSSTLPVEKELPAPVAMPRSGTNLESLSTEVDLESFVKIHDCRDAHDDGKINCDDDGIDDEKSVDDDASGCCSGEGIELFVEFDNNDDIATLRASLGNDTFLQVLSVHLEVYMLLDTIYGKAPTEDYAQTRATAVLDRFAGREDLVVAALRQQMEDEASKEQALAAKPAAEERADATNGDNANGCKRRSSNVSLLKKMVPTKSSRSVSTVVTKDSRPPTGEIESNAATLSGTPAEPIHVPGGDYEADVSAVSADLDAFFDV